MRIVVAYASKHGATQGIAERIATTLRAAGHDAEVEPVTAVRDLAAYDAVVIGSAAYMGSWLKEAAEFVRRNQELLRSKPVWLFSSGPLDHAAKDPQGRDPLTAAEPKEFAEFKEMLKPCGLRVFFGALNPATLGLSERLLRTLPAGRTLLPEGDFREWEEVEAWAESIAREVGPVTAGSA